MGPRIVHFAFFGRWPQRVLRMQRRREILYGATVAALRLVVVRPSFCLIVITLSILLIAHRAPAPIVEENPTPALEEQSTKRSSKSKRRSAEATEENQSSDTAKPKESARSRDRFAGTWTGKINQGIIGDVIFTLTFSAGGSQVTEHTSLGTYFHATTSDGGTATWKSRLLAEIVWTFSPNSDGNTAHVTSKSPFGVNGDT